MTGVTITVDDTAAQAALARLRDAGQNLRPALDAIGLSIVSRMRATFESQADPWGKGWQGLKASTLRKRRKKGAGAQILRDTGRLMNSISHAVGDNEVTIDTEVEYAAIHQFGGRMPPQGNTIYTWTDGEKDGRESIEAYMAYTLKCVRQHPDRFLGCFVYNPRCGVKNGVEAIERYVKEHGFRMVQMQANMHGV